MDRIRGTCSSLPVAICLLGASLGCGTPDAVSLAEELGEITQASIAHDSGIWVNWSGGLKGCFVNDPTQPLSPANYQTTVLQWATWFKDWTKNTGLTIQWLTVCPAPVIIAGKADYRGADGRTVFRFLIDEGSSTTGPIPGADCGVSVDADTSNFGGWPVEETDSNPYKYCQWNGKLLSRARNTLLHELGHKLGLRHEHLRVDSPCEPTAGGFDLTREWDPDSVMGYSPCNANYGGNDGISIGDGFGAQMLYPSSFAPKIRGTLCYGRFCRQGTWNVQTDWYLRGSDVVNNILWTITSGSTVTSGQQIFSRTYSAGAATIGVSFQDHLGRNHAASHAMTISNSVHTAITAAVAL